MTRRSIVLNGFCPWCKMPIRGSVDFLKTPNGWAWRGSHADCPRKERLFRVWAGSDGKILSIERDCYSYELTKTHKPDITLEHSFGSTNEY